MINTNYLFISLHFSLSVMGRLYPWGGYMYETQTTGTPRQRLTLGRNPKQAFSSTTPAATYPWHPPHLTAGKGDTCFLLPYFLGPWRRYHLGLNQRGLIYEHFNLLKVRLSFHYTERSSTIPYIAHWYMLDLLK